MALRRAAQRLSTLPTSFTTMTTAAAAGRATAVASSQKATSSPLQLRHFSNQPVDSVYGGPKPPSERTTLRKLASKYRKGERISVVTAYDYPSAVHVSGALPHPHPSVHSFFQISAKKPRGRHPPASPGSLDIHQTTQLPTSDKPPSPPTPSSP